MQAADVSIHTYSFNWRMTSCTSVQS